MSPRSAHGSRRLFGCVELVLRMTLHDRRGQLALFLNWKLGMAIAVERSLVTVHRAACESGHREVWGDVRACCKAF